MDKKEKKRLEKFLKKFNARLVIRNGEIYAIADAHYNDDRKEVLVFKLPRKWMKELKEEMESILKKYRLYKSKSAV